jgi:hypothetical protein
VRRTERLRYLNAIIWLTGLTICLFFIGFVSRISTEWTKTPLDRIGENNFRFYAAKPEKYFISFACADDTITAAYDLGSNNLQVFPTETTPSELAAEWISVYDGELFSASLAAPFALSGKEALKSWRNFDRTRLQSIRSVKNLAKNKWLALAVLSLGGYWVGDFAGKQFDIPCNRSKDLNWLQSADWHKLTIAFYNELVHNLSLCAVRVEVEVGRTDNPELQGIKARYTEQMLSLFRRESLFNSLVQIYPSPHISRFLEGTADEQTMFEVALYQEITSEDIEAISGAVSECGTILNHTKSP